MTIHLISILKRLVRKGQWVVLTVVGESGETTERGTLLEVDDAGVVLENEERVIFLPSNTILRFEILKSSLASGKEQAPSGDDHSKAKASPNRVPKETAGSHSPKIPPYAFEQFSGEVILHFPQPTFTIERIDEDDRQELVRWQQFPL